MRIGILSQFYAPEPGPAQLPSTLAEEFVRRGHSVRVVTGFPNYPTGDLARGYRLARCMVEIRGGVTIRRVYLHPDHGSGIKRATNYGSFAASSVVNGLSWLRNADAVWVNASPITLALPIWVLRAMGRPVVSHVLDLWPESLFATGFGSWARNRVVTRLLHSVTSSMYRGSDRVAYISPGVRQVLLERKVPEEKLSYVPMWADEKVFHTGGDSMRDELGLAPSATVLLYAGALGEAQGLDALMDACTLVDDPGFVCLVAGSGTAEVSLRSRAAGRSNVRFLGRVPQMRMTDLLATADASYVSLRDTPLGRISIPSKTQAAMAAGTPLVVAAVGDVRTVVEEAGAGLGADPHDARDIAHAISRLCRMSSADRSSMSVRAQAAYAREYSLARAVEQVERLLESAATSRQTIGAVV